LLWFWEDVLIVEQVIDGNGNNSLEVCKIDCSVGTVSRCTYAWFEGISMGLETFWRNDSRKAAPWGTGNPESFFDARIKVRKTLQLLKGWHRILVWHDCPYLLLKTSISLLVVKKVP
jgi:hypothetical protein